MAGSQPPEWSGVFANGRFYRHSPHFLERRAVPYPLGHSEATDERIIYVLENPEHRETVGGGRYLFWGRIRESGADAWWMKVLVAENRSGPVIITAYEDDFIGVVE